MVKKIYLPHFSYFKESLEFSNDKENHPKIVIEFILDVDLKIGFLFLYYYLYHTFFHI